MFSKTSTDLLVQFSSWPRAVEQQHAVRVLPGDYAVSVEHALAEVPSLPLDAVRALADTCRGRVGIHLEDECDVRQEAARRDTVELVDLVDAEIARVALVRERRVDVAVGDDVVPCMGGAVDHALAVRGQ